MGNFEAANEQVANKTDREYGNDKMKNTNL